MKKIRFNRLMQIAYPMLTYLVIYNISNSFLQLFLAEHFGRLICLMIAAVITLPFIYGIYRKVPVVKAPTWFEKEMIGRECLYILAIVLLGVVLNIIISNTVLVEQSNAFANANQSLYDGNLLVKILANAVFIPILEEVLYRGIICGQLSLWYSNRFAILIASILFGIMHFNMVQFLYAFLVGMALSAAYVKCKKLWIPIAAHALTNLVVILVTTFY